MERTKKIKSVKNTFAKYIAIFGLSLLINFIVILMLSRILTSLQLIDTTYDTWKVVAFLILSVAELILLSNLFGKTIKKDLMLLEKITESILSENLDISISGSEIKEIDEIMQSLELMKVELRNTLTAEWKNEENKIISLSAIAHDIKTPLTVVKASSELLMETEQSEEQKEYSLSIYHNVEKIEKYVFILLEVMKYNMEIEMDFQYKDFRNMLDGIDKSFQIMAVNNEIRYELHIGEIPQQVLIDELQLSRVIENIVINAMDYSGKNGIVSLTVNAVDDNLIFIIEDSGKGFSKDEMVNGTKQFYRGDKSRNSQNHFGLGLYIADSIIKKHDGSLTLDKSEKWKGAQVTVKIPIR